MAEALRVFVSHAGRDRAWAEWMAWQLEHAGWNLTVELDCWDWQAGDNFVAKMATALDRCDRMLAVFSQAYFEPARWTTEEWTAAFGLAKDHQGFLVPVRIDDTPPPALLNPLIAPPLHGLSREDARTELLAAIRPPGRPTDEPPLPGSPEWVERSQTVGPRLPGVVPPVWGPVPGPNEAFTGRDGLLVRLREGLQGTRRSVVHALYGAGGVGKTQLAAEYAWRFCGDYDAVWWVDAEQADLIGEQYAAFAVAWGLVDSTTSIGSAVAALRRVCGSRGRWLLIMDNASAARDIQPWRLPGPGHMIIASRDPHWPEIAASLPVDVFTRIESITLLRAHVPNLTDTDRLAATLGDLPLALAQAAGVLSETGMPVSEYLSLLDATAAEVLDEGAPISYPTSLARSVRIAVTRLTAANPAAAQLLTLCAFLAPEPIPTRWFPTATAGALPDQLAATVAAPLVFRRSIGLLGRYGLAKLADDHLTVHRLTQRLVRADTPDPDTTTAQVGQLLAGLSPGRPADPNTWSTWAELLPHLRMLNLADTDNEQLASQACNAALYLLLRGEIHTSHDMIAPLHQAWSDRLGPTSPLTLLSANPLAHTLGALGRPDEAMILECDLLNRNRAALGDDHPDTLTSAHNLAIRLAELGEHEKARALDEETLTRRRRILGDDHPVTLTSANNLAIGLADQGEHKKARTLAEDTLTRRRRILGDNHPNTLTSATNLANRLADLAEHEKARALHEDTFARSRRILGDDHPDTLYSASGLAVQLAAIGDHTQARALTEDTLTRYRRILGDDHPNTLRAASYLAHRLAEEGNYEQARIVAEDTLTRSQCVLGAEHPIAVKSAEIARSLNRLDTPPI